MILIGSMLSCNRSRQTTFDESGTDSLLIKFRALSDSVDRNWAIMISDDDDKHVLMKRLLLEVSYTNNYNKAKFKELNNLIDELKNMRYDQNTMSNSALIDAYDSATFEVADQIIVFAQNHPRYEDFPLMAELINDINAKNNFILIHRIHYDRWAKALNSFNDTHKDKLVTKNPAIEIERIPLFELPS